MPTWLMVSTSLLALLSLTALFLFSVTRGALLWRAMVHRNRGQADHVYPIYSNMHLIRWIDFQPIFAAILLFQYDRLVNHIVTGLRNTDMRAKKALITSCAFGNVMPRVVAAAIGAGARKVQVADIVPNELTHAQKKLMAFGDHLDYFAQDATQLQFPDASVSANVMFFLLHELPHHLKAQCLREAIRVLEPGGKLYLAEFHRPDSWLLRAMSWTYFKVFEPLGLALWDTHDPMRLLASLGGLSCERHTLFLGNFQIIVATKGPA